MIDGNLLQKFKKAVENGIEFDKAGHALKRIVQRNIDYDTIERNLLAYDKIKEIKVYNPPDAYRVYISLTAKKTLVVGVILKDVCVVKTAFIIYSKYQNKVDKLWRHFK